MTKRLAYAAWARMDMAWIPDDQKQALRHNWFSETGKARKYDLYRESAKFQGLDYDGPPESYWQLKKQSWHGVAGSLMGLSAAFLWFIVKIVAGSTGQSKN